MIARSVGALALLLALLPGSAAAEPADFAAEARLMFRVVACAGDEPLPAGLDPAVVEAHCAQMRPLMEHYRRIYIDQAQPFLAKLRRDGLPSRVVYPFGGGDLLSALTTYPDAEEITTMSLEHAGDPRRLRGLSKAGLKASLAVIRETINGLLKLDDSKSTNLMRGQKNDIPGQLAFFVVALAVHQLEPRGLRFLRLEPDGAAVALTAEEIAGLEASKARALHKSWTPPELSPAFSHAELSFAAKGDTKLRVHRHFAANLDDAHFKDSALEKHLQAKGKVAAMTKAASYLLWQQSFSGIRDYLTAHLVFMISDSTGVPLRFARAAGLEIETYGRFESSFLGASPTLNKELRELWARQPNRPLPFRYGYIDSMKSNHLMVTWRPPQAAPP